MKFANLSDKRMFLVELGDPSAITIDDSFEPSEEMVNDFIKKRKELTPGFVSFRKSQSNKSSWRRNRYSFMKGIKRFHKSIAGKRFHRALGRFLTNRILSDRKFESFSEHCDTLKAISSLKTHLYIEMEYYHKIDEHIELESLLQTMIPMLNDVEEKVMMGIQVDDDSLDLMCRVVDRKLLFEDVSMITNVSSSDLEKKFAEVSGVDSFEDTGAFVVFLKSVKI